MQRLQQPAPFGAFNCTRFVRAEGMLLSLSGVLVCGGKVQFIVHFCAVFMLTAEKTVLEMDLGKKKKTNLPLRDP